VIVAMSYDSVELLEQFASSRGIRFPLLSDEGSRVIEALGLLHEQLTSALGLYSARNDLDRFRRVAYPCTFLLDRSGVVIDKVFEEHHLVRRTSDWFLSAADDGTAVARGGAGSVGISISLPSDGYRPGQKLPLSVVLEIAPGYHVYAQPAPDGVRSFRIRIDAGVDATITQDLPAPAGRIRDDLGEEFPVYEESVSWRASVVIPSNQGDIPLSAHFTFQVCSDLTCEPPIELELTLMLRGHDLDGPPAVPEAG